MTMAPGMSTQIVAKKASIAVSVQGGGSGQMQMPVMPSVGTGGTNTAVLSDMIMKEFFKAGYQARGLNTYISDTDVGQMSQLANQGFDIALVGSMNMAMTSSTFGALTGGTGLNTGVTDFTIKGIDVPSGKLLFIMSGRYGVAKNPADVAADIAVTYKEKVTGQPAP